MLVLSIICQYFDVCYNFKPRHIKNWKSGLDIAVILMRVPVRLRDNVFVIYEILILLRGGPYTKLSLLPTDLLDM